MDPSNVFVNREEWEALRHDIHRASVVNRLRDDDDVEFRLVSIEQLEATMTSAAGDTYVVIASCPTHHATAVRELAGTNCNIIQSFGPAESKSKVHDIKTVGLSAVAISRNSTLPSNQRHGTKQLRLAGVLDGTYVGDLVDGKADGTGIWTGADGGVYEGGFSADKRNGHGIHRFADNDVYDGEWRDDKRSGHGTDTFATGNIYSGEWTGGERDGCGIHTSSCGNVCDGENAESKRHGFGSDTLATGERYAGEWEDDKRHGRGVHTTTSGSVYDGEYAEGKRLGCGTHTLATGESYAGEWEMGAFEGKT